MNWDEMELTLRNYRRGPVDAKCNMEYRKSHSKHEKPNYNFNLPVESKIVFSDDELMDLGYDY